MPVNTHLQWSEIKDFKPGLYTVSDWLVPPTAAQTMTDCYPQEAGGLRAFFKPTSMTVSGITSITNERPIAMIAYLTTDSFTGNGLNFDYYLWTLEQTVVGPPPTNRIRVYRRNVAATGPTATWSVAKTFATGTYVGTQVMPIQYISSSGNRVVFPFTIVGSADNGVWSLEPSTQTFTKIDATGLTGTPMVPYQSRLVSGAILADNTAGIRYSDPGGLTYPAANYITLGDGGFSGFPIVLVPYSPSMLLAGTDDGWFLIQGDITDPVVRSMNTQHIPANYEPGSIRTDVGAVIIDSGKGLWATSTGDLFTRIDTQLTPYDDPSNAWIATMGHFIFAPTGRVYDMRTKSWFTSSFVANAIWAHENLGAGTLGSHLFVPTYEATWKLYDYQLDEGTSARAESWTWKSAYLNDSGRQVHIREVELYVNSYGSSSSVAVTVGGTTRTITNIATGRTSLSFLFNSAAKLHTVQIVSASNAGGVEAPSVEVVRIGTRKDSHQLH